MARTTFAGEMLDVLGLEIATGKILPGGALNMDALLERFNVSRTVARDAIKVLESMGLVEVRRRTGLRVKPFDEWNMLDPNIIRWRLAQDDPALPLQSLTELRESIEPIAARLAAHRGADEPRRRLADAAHGMEEAALKQDRRGFLAYDLAFHDALVAASGNELFLTLGRSIRGALEGQSSSGILPVREGSRTVELHRAIAQAVLASDGDGAEAAARALFADMRAHLTAQ
jgi:DNA-binding FadR family transcriptional regulator